MLFFIVRFTQGFSLLLSTVYCTWVKGSTSKLYKVCRVRERNVAPLLMLNRANKEESRNISSQFFPSKRPAESYYRDLSKAIRPFSCFACPMAKRGIISWQ